jgi:hypothetical protein
VLKAPVVKRADDASVFNPSKDRWYVVANTVEAHVLYPLVVGCALHNDGPTLVALFGASTGSALIALATFKVLRQGYSDRSHLWIALTAALLFSHFDEVGASEGLLVDLFVATVLVAKTSELLLKLGFSYTYKAPWNHKDVLGSGLHAFLFPLQLPHSTMMLWQSAIATLFSAPLYPVMGSPVFLVSYFRPIKFFERRFTTTRIDTVDDATTKRYTVGSTANNLNSVFYIQLQRELEATLAADIERGLLGEVTAGAILLLTNLDNSMSGFVHIIDVGHGFVSFQLRGLEFAGTFCQAQELQALDEEEKQSTYPLCRDAGCCEAGLLGRVMSYRTMFGLRWKTWHQLNARYRVKGYSISLLSATNLMPTYELRTKLRCFIYQALAYYMTRHPNLAAWLEHEAVKSVLEEIDDDFSEEGPHLLHGNSRSPLDNDTASARGRMLSCCITLDSFLRVHRPWLDHCLAEVVATRLPVDAGGGDAAAAYPAVDSPEEVKKLVFYGSVMVRRLLASFNHKSKYGVMPKPKKARRADDWLEVFFQGYHRLFQGRADYDAVGCAWVSELDGFAEMLVQSTQMALRLFQDYVSDPDSFDDLDDISESLEDYDGDGPMRALVCPETDPRWEAGVMSGMPSMLSFRHLIDDSSYNGTFYAVVLTSRKQDFKVYHVNREAVRGLWAAQQQELLFFKNPDAERGSIQNAKCVLRNLVSQSADHPVGYATHISEIVHSYSGTNRARGPIGAMLFRLRQLRRWTSRQLKKKPGAAHLADGTELEALGHDAPCDGELLELAELAGGDGNGGDATVINNRYSADGDATVRIDIDTTAASGSDRDGSFDTGDADAPASPTETDPLTGGNGDRDGPPSPPGVIMLPLAI